MESKVEVAKRQGRHLRGTIGETLAAEATHFAEDDVSLLKFHGTYQQDDRDLRRAREAAGQGKAYAFMVRVAVPAGAITAEQYLGLEEIADEHGNHTLRVTTRQGFQFHGVLKGDLKATIAGVNQKLLTTIAVLGASPDHYSRSGRWSGTGKTECGLHTNSLELVRKEA